MGAAAVAPPAGAAALARFASALAATCLFKCTTRMVATATASAAIKAITVFVVALGCCCPAALPAAALVESSARPCALGLAGTDGVATAA